MRATFVFAPGDVRVIDVPDPVIRLETDAVVRVVRSCICGSDVHTYRTMNPAASGNSIGHEFIGVVERVGSDVRTISPGDFVVAPLTWSDGTCDFCVEGLHTSCRHG